MRETKLTLLVALYLYYRLTGPLRIPVLKVTNFRCSFGKIPKIPVLELVVNKIGDTFLHCRLFVADLAYIL